MIVFASRTGNVRYIIEQLNLPSTEIVDGLTITEPYFIFTYTDKIGQVPKKVLDFLSTNHEYCKGVIASGNTNWGHKNFCKSADTISNLYDVPVIRKLDIRGFQADYDSIIEQYKKIIKGE